MMNAISTDLKSTPPQAGNDLPRTDAPRESGPEQFLTFLCGGEEYGIDILRVQEIKGWSTVTRVPHSAPYVLGVLNLRGMIVPVLSLRTRFDLEERPFDASTVIIVVKVHRGDQSRIVGVVADAVSEVYGFAREAIRPTPDVGSATEGACISGIATVGTKMVMLLDIDRLIGGSV